MSLVRYYLKDTQTNAGTGGTIYDLSSIQGTSASLTSGNQNNDTFDEKLRWQYTADGTVQNTSFDTSININTITNSPGYRWRLQRVDSGGTVQASSNYSQVENTTGTKTATLTLSTTWSEGDILRFSLEVNRDSGHNPSGVTVSVNDANSWVDVLEPEPQTFEESLTLSTTSDILAESEATFENSVTLSTTSDVVSQADFIFDNAITLSTTSDVASQASLDFANTLTLSTTADVIPLANTINELGLTLSSAGTLTTTGSLSFDQSITLSTVSDLTTVGGLSYDEAVTLLAAADAEFVEVRAGTLRIRYTSTTGSLLLKFKNNESD